MDFLGEEDDQFLESVRLLESIISMNSDYHQHDSTDFMAHSKSQSGKHSSKSNWKDIPPHPSSGRSADCDVWFQRQVEPGASGMIGQSGYTGYEDTIVKCTKSSSATMTIRPRPHFNSHEYSFVNRNEGIPLAIFHNASKSQGSRESFSLDYFSSSSLEEYVPTYTDMTMLTEDLSSSLSSLSSSSSSSSSSTTDLRGQSGQCECHSIFLALLPEEENFKYIETAEPLGRTLSSNICDPRQSTVSLETECNGRRPGSRELLQKETSPRNCDRKHEAGKHLPFITRGKAKGPRTVRPGCGERCRLKCHLKLDRTSREQIFINYWTVGSLQRQRDFLSAHVTRSKTRLSTTKHRSRRKKTLHYYLPTPGDAAVKVCKTFYLDTLGICDKIVRTALAKADQSATAV